MCSSDLELYGLCGANLYRYTRFFDGWHRHPVLDAGPEGSGKFLKVLDTGNARHVVVATRRAASNAFPKGALRVEVVTLDDEGALRHQVVVADAADAEIVDAHLDEGGQVLITVRQEGLHAVSVYRVGSGDMTSQTFNDIYIDTDVLPGPAGKFMMVRRDEVNHRILVHTLTP